MFENEKIPFILVDFTILVTEKVVPFHAPQAGVDVGEQVEDLEVGSMLLNPYIPLLSYCLARFSFHLQYVFYGFIHLSH